MAPGWFHNARLRDDAGRGDHRVDRRPPPRQRRTATSSSTAAASIRSTSEYARPGHVIATGTPGAPIDEAVLGTWALGPASRPTARSTPITLARRRPRSVRRGVQRDAPPPRHRRPRQRRRGYAVVSVLHDPDLHPRLPALPERSRATARPRSPTSTATATSRSCSRPPPAEVHAFDGERRRAAGLARSRPTSTACTPASAAFTSGAVSAARPRVGPRARSRSAISIATARSRWWSASTQGKLYVFSADRRAASGISSAAPNPAFSDPAIRNEAEPPRPGIFATPALADLDRDGRLEIVVGSLRSPPLRLARRRHDAARLPDPHGRSHRDRRSNPLNGPGDVEPRRWPAASGRAARRSSALRRSATSTATAFSRSCRAPTRSTCAARPAT